jgi:hemerythrin superfamily protein
MTETIYDALRESHEIQRSLCRRLIRSKPDSSERQQIFRELRIELSAHEAAEERYLYVPMLMDDMGLNASRHALHEHHELDELVEDLQAANDGRSWAAIAKQLSKKVHHHLREEEKKFFQVSGKILSETQKTRLAKQYRRDYTRMHKTLAAG